jgi:hypothetical protein
MCFFFREVGYLFGLEQDDSNKDHVKLFLFAGLVVEFEIDYHP